MFTMLSILMNGVARSEWYLVIVHLPPTTPNMRHQAGGDDLGTNGCLAQNLPDGLVLLRLERKVVHVVDARLLRHDPFARQLAHLQLQRVTWQMLEIHVVDLVRNRRVLVCHLHAATHIGPEHLQLKKDLAIAKPNVNNGHATCNAHNARNGDVAHRAHPLCALGTGRVVRGHTLPGEANFVGEDLVDEVERLQGT